MSATSPTWNVPLRRQRFWADPDGAMVTVKDKDENLKVSIDWTDALASGETVSTSAWTASGVTTASPTLATPVASVVVTGTDGYVENLATMSTGRVLKRRIRFTSPAYADRESDYQG